MKFFSKKEDKKITLVYDIGSASVSGALVIYSENDIPEIIYSTRKEIAYQEKFDVGRFNSLIVSAVDDVSSDIQKNGLSHLKFTKFGEKKPHRAFVALSSPWHASQTRVMKLSEDKPFLITKDKVEKWIAKEVDSFKNSDYIKQYDNAGAVKIIEQNIVSVKLNGYETSNQYGKKATTFEAAVAISVSPEEIIEKIDNAINRTFADAHIEFNSFPLISFSVIRDMDKENEDFIFLDISGELTDVLISKNGIPFEVTTFPIGKNDILRKLSQELGTNKDEVISLLSLHSGGELNDTEIERVGSALNKVQNEWVVSFQKTLEDMREDFSIPSSIFFTSDTDLVKWFEKSIKSEQFGQFTMSDKPFSVIPINTSFLSKNVKVRGDMKRDLFLMINSIFFNKLV